MNGYKIHILHNMFYHSIGRSGQPEITVEDRKSDHSGESQAVFHQGGGEYSGAWVPCWFPVSDLLRQQ